MNARTSDLAEVRRLLESRFASPFPLDRTPEQPTLPTGIAELDRILPGGGLPRGGLVEISGPPSSGKTGLLFALLAGIQDGQGGDGPRDRSENAALIDPTRAFFGPAAQAAGIDLEQLLLIRPPLANRPAEAVHTGLRILDHLLRSTGFSLVALDLAGFNGLEPMKPAGNDARPALDRLFRIARLARVSETVALLLTGTPADRPSLGSPVSLRLSVARTGFCFSPGPRTPFSLGGLWTRVEIQKNKYGRPGGGVSLLLDPDLRS